MTRRAIPLMDYLAPELQMMQAPATLLEGNKLILLSSKHKTGVQQTVNNANEA